LAGNNSLTSVIVYRVSNASSVVGFAFVYHDDEQDDEDAIRALDNFGLDIKNKDFCGVGQV